MLLAAYILMVHIGATHGVFTALKDSGFLGDGQLWKDWVVTFVFWPYILGLGLSDILLNIGEEEDE